MAVSIVVAPKQTSADHVMVALDSDITASPKQANQPLTCMLHVAASLLTGLFSSSTIRFEESCLSIV